jgi:hypothetical protein
MLGMARGGHIQMGLRLGAPSGKLSDDNCQTTLSNETLHIAIQANACTQLFTSVRHGLVGNIACVAHSGKKVARRDGGFD